MNEKLLNLLQKKMSAELNSDEEKELAGLILDSGKDELIEITTAMYEQYIPNSEISQIEKERILHSILYGSSKPVIPFKRAKSKRWIAAVAACAVILLSVGTLYLKNQLDILQERIIVTAEVIPTTQKTTHNRYIKLADGSTVVLKAGSTLDVSDQFNAANREISLSGEAYFDIAHNPEKPFIIHTGNVKTTVLGTAFDIKAWPNQKEVIVSVTRGKVRVEKNNKILAQLTKNEQIELDEKTLEPKLHKVDAEAIVNDWTKTDLTFEDVSLHEVVKVLSERYGQSITISNEEIASIHVVTSFSGTESLENIIDILCTLNKTQYYEKDQTIYISDNN
ncbi:MAG TPA: FecR domain-containing protein [Paludibacter sp.]|nr:FecR domain-containing protein [Paludibacter sp.]